MIGDKVLFPPARNPARSLSRLRHARVAALAILALAGLGDADRVAAGSEFAAGHDYDDTVDRPTPPVNVILLMADDLGYGDVGFLGNDIIKTPHLDEMAANGLVFTRFYAAAPVCSPTRGSCLTGRHPARYAIHGANEGHLPAAEITLAEVLRDRGYATGHFGKWHLGTLTREIEDGNRGGPEGAAHFSPPWEHGFERCFSTEAKTPTYDPMWKPKNASGRFWLPLEQGAERLRYGTHYFDEHGRVVDEDLDGDDSRIIMDRAIPFIDDAAQQGRPFFAVIWFHAPHRPMVASPEEHARYADRTPNERSYYGSVTALDAQVGRLRARLRQLGVADDTMIWFASDNGPEGQAGDAPGSAGTLRGRKRSLFEGGIRVPAILEWPGHVAPAATAHPAVTSDYLPTVYHCLGLELPDDRPMDGLSLHPALFDARSTRGSAIGFQSKEQRAWIDDRYKLLSTDDGASFMLYDLRDDPAEAQDLAPARPEIATGMIAQLDAWIRSCRESADGADYDRSR